MKLLRILPRFQHAYRSLDELAQRETWSRSQIAAFQLERINELWTQATTRVPYYHDLQTKGKLPQHFRDIAEFHACVPIVPKSELRRHAGSFLASPLGRGRWHRTGGSTGSPMSFFWEQEAHQQVLRARYRLYAMWDVDPLDRTAFLWGHQHVFSRNLTGYLSRLQQQFLDHARGRLRLSAYRLGEKDVQLQLQRLVSFGPAMLYGFSRAIYMLALEALRTGLRCESLRLVTLTSEVASPQMVSTVERAFGVPAIIEYGASECHLIAGEWTDRTLRVREDVVHLETLPRDDGRYDLVLTVLGNPSAPLIRYKIGDVTDAPLHIPSHGFAILRNVAGRQDDLLVTRSGRLIHPTLVDAMFEESNDKVRRYRVHQHADGSLVASIELQGSCERFNAAPYARRLTEMTEGYPSHIHVVDRIELTAAGKHRTVTSALTSENMVGHRPTVI